MAFSLPSFLSHIPLIGKALTGIVNLGEKLFHSLDFVSRAFDLAEEAVSEYNAIRDFQSRPAWKNRVISVPRVVENIQTLVEIPQKLLTAFRDLVKQIKSLAPSSGVADVEEIFADVDGLADVKGLLEKISPKINEGFGRLLGFLAIFVQAAQTLSNSIDDLKTVVDSIKQIRMDIENLDGLFLPQNNKRETLQLTSGKTIRIRVGSLHGKTRS